MSDRYPSDDARNSNLTASSEKHPPEELLARAIKFDLGVDINPQALRIFLRCRWDRLSTLAHKIHQGGTP